MAINRAQLAKELEPGLNALFGMEYSRYENEHAEIFDNEASETKSMYVLGEQDYSLITMVNDSLDVFSSVNEDASDYWIKSQYDFDFEGALGSPAIVAICERVNESILTP